MRLEFLVSRRDYKGEYLGWWLIVCNGESVLEKLIGHLLGQPYVRWPGGCFVFSFLVVQAVLAPPEQFLSRLLSFDCFSFSSIAFCFSFLT